LRSSSVFASHTVQVMSDAKARPTITVLTSRSAFSNMFQSDRSSGRSARLIVRSAEAGLFAGFAAAGAAIGVGLAPAGCAGPLGAALLAGTPVGAAVPCPEIPWLLL